MLALSTLTMLRISLFVVLLTQWMQSWLTFCWDLQMGSSKPLKP